MAKQKKIMRALKLNEISIVDRPAQEGATVLIMKRKDDSEKGRFQTGDIIATTEKDMSAIMSGVQENHQHAIKLIGFDGGKLTHGRTSWEDDHDHPWVLMPDGNIVVGLHEGHSHEGFAPGELMSLKAKELPKEGTSANLLSKRESGGQNNVEKEDDMSDKDFEAINKRLERAEKVAELSDIEKAHFKTLDAEKQDTFLAMDDDARKKEHPFAIDEDDEKKKEDKAKDKAKKAADEAGDKVVVYKSISGDEYFNTDDARLVAQVKINDDLIKRVEASEKKTADQAYAKRAEDELGHLPGTVETRVALLKSVDKIEDKDQREGALAALKSKNEQHGMVFETIGEAGMTQLVAEKGSAEDQLDELAKKRAESDKTDYHTAYSKVLDTPQGADLYAKSVAA